MDSPDTLQQAIDVARSGNRTVASRLLAQYVTQDPKNDVAWLWLAACLDEPEQQRYCLQKASALNPNNPDTISALNELINPPWAWNEPASAIILPPGNGSLEEDAVVEAPAAEPEVGPVYTFEAAPEAPEPAGWERENLVIVDTPETEPVEPAPDTQKNGMSGRQSGTLILLVVAILVVLGVLGYLVLTAPPDSLPAFLRSILYGNGIILGLNL